MKKRTKIALAAGATAISAVAGFGMFRWNYRMPLKEYTANALYMAVLDDEICRRELADLTEFPSKKETLQYKYHLFLELNRRKSRKEIQQEISKLEYRLNSLDRRETEDAAIEP